MHMVKHALEGRCIKDGGMIRFLLYRDLYTFFFPEFLIRRGGGFKGRMERPGDGKPGRRYLVGLTNRTSRNNEL
jgi:hypothetical protein